VNVLPELSRIRRGSGKSCTISRIYEFRSKFRLYPIPKKLPQAIDLLPPEAFNTHDFSTEQQEDQDEDSMPEM
jgi:hypothetical protein